MGIQGRGDKSEMDELRAQVLGMRMEINELKRATQTQGDAEDYCSDVENGAAASSSRRQKVAAAHRRHRRRSAPTESDDAEETPGHIKSEQRAQAANTGSQIAPKPVPTLSRKRPFDTPRSSDLSDSESVGPVRRGKQRKRGRYATEPTKSKRVQLSSDSDEPDTNDGPAKALSTSREKPAAGVAHKKFTGSKSTGTTPSKPAAVRTPPVFKPQYGKLPMPQWASPISAPANTFVLPTCSPKLNAIFGANVNKQQKESTKAGPPQHGTTNSFKRSYAEILPFEFKLVVSYSDDGMEYHQSTDLENDMKSFWSKLKRLRKGWEEAAGAEWAWELQKPSKARNGRLCVSATLAKQSTRWREGDSGDYACQSCVMNASLCFTWVKDEDAEHDQEDEAAVPGPKGEFWCLPVHSNDSRCKATKGREIRTWLNEGNNSETDSSGEEIEESSEEDDFKVESDDDQSFGSWSSSSSSEEDGGEEGDEDDEL